MSHAPTAFLDRRHQTIRRALADRKLDALVVTSLPNVLYLTNFSGSAAIVVVTADRLHFITDFRYVTSITDTRGSDRECPALELVVVDGSYDATLAATLKTLSPARAGFEANDLPVSRYEYLRGAIGGSDRPELVSTEGIVQRARTVKDAYELGVFDEAASRLSAVARRVVANVARGRSERDTALDIDWEIRKAGFERAAFDTIVASGPNAALPHARPTDRKLSEGDLVVLDFGGVYDSYCVDLTRTVSVGRAATRTREVYEAVRNAHDRAVTAVAPGQSRFAIDAAARTALGEVGMAEAFGHGTGHGLGIEIHEDPRISKRRPEGDGNDEAVTAGMVFTIEPGAYFPGWGGVRIEDDVVVTSTGVRVLTDVPTELVEI